GAVLVVCVYVWCVVCGLMYVFFVVFFFFQAEDGIRDDLVTGVQTCALPISFWKTPTWTSCTSERAFRANGSPRARRSRFSRHPRAGDAWISPRGLRRKRNTSSPM